MKKIKFKQLATFSLCCSLLVNSLTGVTAVAETMTIESSPTVESKEQTEDTKETAENEVTETLATETSEAPNVESQEEKETSADVVEKKKQEAVVGNGNSKTAEDTNVGESLVQPKQISPKATVNFPQLTYQFGFIDETGKRVDASTINLAYDIWAGESFITNDWKTLSIEKGRFAPTNNNLKEITYYKQSLNTVSGRTWQYSAANLTFFPPKYYEKMSVYNKNGTFDTAYSFPNINAYTDVSSNVMTENATKNLSKNFELTKSGNQSFVFNQTTSSAPADVNVPHFLRETIMDPDKGYVGNGTYFMLDKPVYYYLTYRKVTENFVDPAGNKLTNLPTGFVQGKQTAIDSDSYIFTQSGTLPKSYKGTNGKTYVLKGWYKGKTKPTTLKTTKTPSYAVTYDGNDDLNVVYEEAVDQTATIPAVTYKFGFVNEKGTLVAPSSFAMKTNLTTVINATPKQVGTATGVNNGNLKHLTIPSQQLTYTPAINPAFSGATGFQLTVPKYYKMPTVKPGAHYTGSGTAYPIATSRLRFLNSARPDERLEVNGEQYALKALATAHSYRMYLSYWTVDTTKTSFSGVLSRAVTDSDTGNSHPSYYTTDDTMYYFLENRRVTENFVDSNGTKITPPPSFTQGKQTVIDSDNFTYTQKGTLPYIYKVNNKPYVLKGWYKGKAKPAKLNQISTDNRNISYPVTYDDQDDVTVVYDEVKLGGNTIQFGFVNEQGKYIPPTSKFNVSTDVGVVKDATYAKLQTVNSSVKGNYLSLTIPAYNPTGGLGQGQTYYGTLNSIVTIPKYYKTPTLTPPSNYQGTAYPAVTGVWDSYNGTTNVYSPSRLSLTPDSNSQTNYQVRKVLWGNEVTKTGFSSLYKMTYNNIAETAVDLIEYYATGTVNYYLENRRVTENFVDASGAKLPSAPTGFTQGKQTVIDSDAYTFTQSGTLPKSYKGTDGKTYVLKGWYKGKTKPDTLRTDAPSYPVTFDDNDDLNVVYEESVEQTTTVPELTYKFGFINEKGEYVAPTNFAMTTNLTEVRNATATKVGTATGTNVGNLKQLTIPGRQLTYTPDVNPSFYGATDFRVVVPKYYQIPTVTPGTNYNGSTTAYPIATTKVKYVSSTTEERVQTDGQRYGLYATNTANSYAMYRPSWASDSTNTNFAGVLTSFTTQDSPSYFTTDDTMYYFLENRRVTENFVDTNGTKISPPLHFEQGRQTIIDSEDFTYTMNKELPNVYRDTTNDKLYQFVGWYKGKIKPDNLETGKIPSYPVTYDDQDDVTMVYKESPVAALPEKTLDFYFVDEAGKFINPSEINLSTDYIRLVSSSLLDPMSPLDLKDKVPLTAVNITDKKQLVVPETGSLSKVPRLVAGLTDVNFKIPKRYKNITITPNEYYSKTAPSYPLAQTQSTDLINSTINLPTYDASKWLTLIPNGNLTDFTLKNTLPAESSLATYPMAAGLYHGFFNVDGLVLNGTNGPVYYYLENRRVTENFVDATGAKLPSAPTGFTQGNQIPMTSDTFKYTAAKALPASYTAGGKTYIFQGWYKGKTKPNTLTTSTTPTYNTTFDDNDDMTAVYKEASISANLTMRGAVDIIDNGATMEYWEVLLKNTGEAPLTSIKIKPTAEWAAGISTPTELFLLGTGQNTKVLPITKEQWEAGFEIPLDSSLPVGGQLTINLIGTKVTGQPNQVLKAAVEVTGNFGNLKASDTVRIKDLDQETKEPTGEGFISVPTFDFGQVGVAGATKQHGLKKAADYYGNGTRNPYLRLKKTQPNWSLTAQLSQPKSAKDSLPTATRLIFGQVPVASVANYNQPTELVTSVGVTKALALTANNSSTSIIGTQEFGGADIYQLDFQFDKVKLEVPANQGTKGEQYNATVTWNLVTGP